MNFYLPLSNSKRRKFQGVRVYDSVVGSDQVQSLVAEVSMKPRERGGGLGIGRGSTKGARKPR